MKNYDVKYLFFNKCKNLGYLNLNNYSVLYIRIKTWYNVSCSSKSSKTDKIFKSMPCTFSHCPSTQWHFFNFFDKDEPSDFIEPVYIWTFFIRKYSSLTMKLYTEHNLFENKASFFKFY